MVPFGSVPWRPWRPICIRVTRLSSEHTTWSHLHGSGSDQPRDSGGSREVRRASIAGASGEAGWEWTQRMSEKERNPHREMGKVLSFVKWVWLLLLFLMAAVWVVECGGVLFAKEREERKGRDGDGRCGGMAWRGVRE